MNLLLKLSAFVFLLSAFACKSSKDNTSKTDTNTNTSQPSVEENKKQSFVIGSGGGVTGKYTEYQFSTNGDVQKRISQGKNEAWENLKTISKDEASALFKLIDEYKLKSLICNKPGNMSYYIIVMVEGKEHKILWGNEAPSEQAKAFYDKAMGFVK